MLKMIIVDDEKIIRETIHSLIDWNSLGIDVAAVCKDGIEAFDCIPGIHPEYSQRLQYRLCRQQPHQFSENSSRSGNGSFHV